MATASCGNLTFNGYRFYNGGWSSPTYTTSFAASYSKTGTYVTVDKITLPSFTNAQFVAPYTFTLSVPVISNHSTNKIYVYLCSSDPGSTTIYATSPSPTQAPSSYIGSGSTTVTYNDSNSHATSITVTCSSTDLSSGGTYYLWIQSDSLSQIHYGSKPSGSLTGTLATFTITYNANGGSNAPASQTKTYGTNLTLRTNVPTRTGYTFLGWSTSSTATSATWAAGGTYSTEASNTLYAVWKINSYTYTLGTGTGVTTTGSTASGSKNYGTTITLKATANTGYTWKQWTSSNTSLVANTTTANTSFTMPAGNITMTPSATANTYTVTFNSNGGTTPSPTSKTVTYNSTYGTLPTVTRTGYTFAGWYTAASGGTQVTSSTTVTITAAQTLYAHWTVNSYQFTLGSCTGVSTTGSTTSGSKNYGTTITLKATVSAGYTWDQWTSSNTSLVGHKADASSSFTMPAGAITMTPKATANLYYVHYNGNGSTGGTMSNSTHTYGTSKNLTKNAYTKDGYEFLGWSTSATGDVIYADQQSVLNLTTTNNGTVTLYAVWEPLSQLFIWHNGAWHRALRYIYTTTDGGTPYTLTVQRASSTASSYSHSVYETNSSNQLVSTTTGSSSTCTIYDNKTTLVQINRTNGQTIRLTLISGNATIKTHSSVATYKIFSITNPTSNIVCQYDVDEKIFEM